MEVGFEVLTAVSTKMAVFWFVARQPSSSLWKLNTSKDKAKSLMDVP
jgi:hypothetical protein